MEKTFSSEAVVRAAIAAALTLAPGTAAAQVSEAGSRTGQGPHVRVELTADRAVPGPGMQLGLRFDLDPGWHIYWQNPGDSGGPPEVTWTFPPGMTAAGIEWPTPERLDIGGLVNYGYHDQVVLPVVVAVASGARIPKAFTVRASVRWMVCADLCVPGRADLTLTLPLSTEERGQVAGWKTAIEDARSRVPVPAPHSWKASARATSEAFVVDVMTGTREEQAVFFPLEVSQVNDSAAQVVTPLPAGLRLVLRKSSQLMKDPAVLNGVISLRGARAFVVSAAVKKE